MADLFISYKAEDRSRVEPLVDALEAEGLSVWWDARVGGGEAWRETISQQLDAAPCVIVVWSKRSTGPEGRFVRDEASRAQRRGTYLPVTIDKVDPPLGFGETQALPLSGWKGDTAHPKYRAVSDCVHAILGRERRDRTAAPLPPHARSVDRRTALAAGGAAAVAAGVVGWFLLRPSGANANTIAVLPFANLSGDPAQGYFSDGIAEELRNALAAIAGLEVVARTSSEMLRNADAKTAAHKLSVANVITGSVRRSSSTIRVSAQLIDGENGLERWSQSFDRPLGDVLQIQSDIAANVARALRIQLAGRRNIQQVLGGTSNPEAQDLLLQVTAAEGDDSSEAFLRRIALLDRAIQLDPNYAEAWARKGLQQSIWAGSWARDAAEKDRVQGDSIRSAQRAVAIAPRMPLAHATLGLIYRGQLAMRRSIEEFQQSVDGPGASSLALGNYALVLSNVRRQAEAEAMVDRALGIDPLDPFTRMIQSWVLFYGRRYQDSIEAGRRTLATAPQNSRARSLVGFSLLMLGRPDEARAAVQPLPADDYRRLVIEATIAGRAGRTADALDAIRAIEQRYGDAANYQYAQIYAGLGMIDKGVAALEAAWGTRDSGLGAMLVDPFIDPLRKDPRFAAVAQRVFT